MGMEYLFLGVEANDEEGLSRYRKQVSLDNNRRALELARELDIMVAINIIVDPDWDEARFASVRRWSRQMSEIIHLTVHTPYPGTESWFTEPRRATTRDYRLFDIQHAVLPTRLPLKRFYEELVRTQAVLNRTKLGVSALLKVFSTIVRLLLRGRTNFVKMIWKFDRVYNARRQYADHFAEVKYEMKPRPPGAKAPGPAVLYVHLPAALVSAAPAANENPGGKP